MMKITIAIILLILSIILWKKHMNHLSMLIFNVGYWIASIDRKMLCKEELLIMGYPEKKLKDTKKYAILFDLKNKEKQ